MGNTVDIIKGLIMRINTYKYRNNNKKMVIRLLADLKKSFFDVLTGDDDNIFLENYKKLSTSEVCSVYITNNFYPKNMQEYALHKNIYGFSNDFRFEIRWLIASICLSQDAINDFVFQREKYDTYILLDKYEEALTVVTDIEEKYGVSFWTMECRFFLNGKLGGDNNELIDDAPENIFGSVLSYFELKNRESITSDEYFYMSDKEISNARKHLKECEDIVEFFNYCISGNIYQSEPEKILCTLSVIQHCSIIDRYLFVIKICNELMNQPKSNYLYVCMQRYIGWLEEINDDHLVALRFIFDQKDNRKANYKLKKGLDSAKSNFILGNLRQARKDAVKLLELFPNNTEAMRLLVETNILIGDDKKQFEGTNLGLLLERLLSIYTLDESRDDAIEDVNKLALRCSQSTWAQSIVSDIVCRCNENKGFDYVHHKIVSNLQHLDMETVLVSLEKDECIQFIMEKMDESNKYVQFRKALLNKDFKSASEICNIVPIQDYLFICDDNSTVDKMKHLHSIEGVNASIAILTMKEFLGSIDIEKDSDRVFEIVANLIVDNIYTSLFIPWRKIIAYIDKGPSEIRKNICIPILYYIYAYYIDQSKKDDLGIVCSDFFFFENIERPSAMDVSADKYNKKLFIYFLKHVCTPKIMDDAIWVFENTQERDQERVEICNLLSHIDIDNAKDYENEIREITQKLMINKELKIIDESRIHVNVEGIRERLNSVDGSGNRFDKSLKNDFQRYLFYQDERIHQWFRLVRGEESTDKFKEFFNTAERLLREIIYKIRDAFVSSDEYGLNGYLSLNIRHNTLDDELRSPLHKSMLYVKKDVDNKKYIVNEHWIRYASERDKEILQNAFARFHVATEGILAKLKGEYIQIKTESKNEKGVFDYTLYDGDMRTISLCVENIVTFEEFFDIVVNYFWKITERNLDSIKYIINTEIKQDYRNVFANLRNDVMRMSNKSILRELQQKISETELDMQNSLVHICHWFQRSNESKHNDFDLQFAFNLGLQTIENMHPEKHFVLDELEKTVSDKIPGNYLKSYDGIFYNLFDNIYKKAIPNSQNGTVRIGYALQNVNGKIRIYIENDYDCTKDISTDLSRVEEAKRLYESGDYLDRVTREGGTGIPKICKIINYELKRCPVIDLGYKKEENIFFIEIKM